MNRKGLGTLVIIGGHEDKEGDKLILRAVAERVRENLVVATVASQGHAREQWEEYEQLFRGLGVRHVHHLNVESRDDAKSDAAIATLRGADTLFFTGGDQLKITSQLGDSPVYERVHQIFAAGGTIAGTSAGASVMCETMMVGGGEDGAFKIGGTLRMAPGFGLLRDAIVDQHFAERGRLGRLLGAVTQNPRILGIGIDENTAVIVRRRRLAVIGDGAVTVVDGQDVTYSNLSEEQTDRALSVYNARLHLLSMGDTFDLTKREPRSGPAEEAEEEILGKEREEKGEAAD